MMPLLAALFLGLLPQAGTTPFSISESQLSALSPSVGITFYRARYYDSHIGRFISEDPAGFYAADFHLNRFVSNIPNRNLDPFGTNEYLNSLRFFGTSAGFGFVAIGAANLAGVVMNVVPYGNFIFTDPLSGYQFFDYERCFNQVAAVTTTLYFGLTAGAIFADANVKYGSKFATAEHTAIWAVTAIALADLAHEAYLATKKCEEMRDRPFK